MVKKTSFIYCIFHVSLFGLYLRFNVNQDTEAMKFNYLILFLLIVTTNSYGQTKYTVSGTVKDEKTGEFLIAATISVDELTNVGAVTNEYGFYSLTLPNGNYTLRASYFGYQSHTKAVKLKENSYIDWSLSEDALILEEVIISSEKKDDNLTKAAMGVESLNMKDVEVLPVIFGEKDILKTITLLPGIKSAGEGNSGFSVRGGATDQNLILLDEAPVYNASHLMGFFSTFNSDAIKDVTVIKGNSPARYGGRLSSVLDVKMKDGNNKEYNLNGGIGLISSRLTVEGPIQKEKSSFIVSGRRTYADLFLKASEDFKDNKLFFYDLNAKANFYINENNRIYASGYFGQDVLGVGSDFGIDWGNATATLRWNSILSARFFSNTSFIYSKYNYNIQVESGDSDFNIYSDIEDFNLKQDFSFFANPENMLRFGFQSIHHDINPSTFTGSLINRPAKEGSRSLENGIYISNTFTPNEKWSIDYGLRGTLLALIGNDNTYNIYKEGENVDQVFLKKGEIGKTYFNIEPRITANYRLDDSKSVKAGYARNSQHLHLLSNSVAGSPTDQWVGSSYNIKPQIADLISMGFSQNFMQNNYEMNIEGYYKMMKNQVDFRDGADLQSAVDVESELLYGIGRAYGMEMILKKKNGRSTGWISYTLSKSERKIDGINSNEWYNARQDMTHSISVVGVHQLSRRWSLSGLFVLSTGQAVTFPTGKHDLNGNTIFIYGDRNADRMPANHRLDLSATYEFKKRKRFESSLNFGVYNVYGRQNPFSITFRDNESDPTITEAVQISLFRWVPSITYNFKF